MKNLLKLIGIIVFAAVIGFSMGACLDIDPALISISATYTQGSTKVTPSTPLDELKANLKVTANYSDGSDSTVSASDY